MPGFFNQQNTPRRVMQFVNLAAATAAAYDLLTNPESHYSEIALDIGVHLSSAYLLKNDDNILGDLSTFALNMTRMGTLYSAFTTGCTSVPPLLNAFDSGIHAMTAFTGMFVRTEGEEPSVREENPSPNQ